MPLTVCPTCRQKFDTDRSEALPFCSERCRMIDLGRWLSEEYSLPVDPEADVAEMDDEGDASYDDEL